MEDRQSAFNPSAALPGVRSVNYVDLYGTYALSDRVSIKAGINNVLDEKPPEVSGQIGQTRIGTYDVIGPAFSVGLRATF
jgi:outer membrane receptor protein involved in Fe transport